MPHSIESERRRLIRHGFVFLVIALCEGIAIATLPHPRAWLSAHVTSFLTCFVLVAIGLVWRELRLTDRQRSVAQAAGFTSAYVGLAANVFVAVVGLPGPASEPGVTPPMPQAGVFYAFLAVVVPATFTAFGLVLFGMRGEPER